MRKSLGDKRKQISEDQIKHITELYMNALAVAADEEHPDHGKVKIFGTRDFGYHRITVERPLKLRFEITEDTLAALEASKPLAKWDGRDVFIAAVRGLLGTVWWTKKEASGGPARGGQIWRRALADHGRRTRRRSGRRSRSPTPRAKSRGQGRRPRTGPRPARLRERAVGRGHRRLLRPRGNPTRPRRLDRPTKTKVGYEIPFTRHFYVYTPPRPLAEIDAELRDLESQIQKLLGEVTG